MAAEDDHSSHILREDGSSNGQGVAEDSVSFILTKVEDDLAYCSEKLLNLETILTQLAGRSIDFNITNKEDEDTLSEYVESAFELDILSGILSVEVKELQSFIISLKTEIVNAHHNHTHFYNLEESNVKIIEKLHDADESAKKSHDLVAYVRKQLLIFKRNLGFSTSDSWADEFDEFGNGNGHLPSANTKWISLTVNQQRHVLQQLDKSLARELDLEKKLSDSSAKVEDLMLKLHYAESELYSMEETVDYCLGKVFESENSAELLLGISRELIEKYHAAKLNISESILHEQDTKSQFQESIKTCDNLQGFCSVKEAGVDESVKEVRDQSLYAETEISSLKEKVRILEEQIKESCIQLQDANASVEKSQEQQNSLHLEITRLENLIEDLKTNILKTENNAEGLESKCLELNRANDLLSKELDFLRNKEAEKTSDLEKKLNKSEARLEDERTTVKANEELQNLLYATISDMESTIKELKGKVSKAESRADTVESKCISLTDSNIELNEELVFLRGRVESLEVSLQHAEDIKRANAKEIGARTKVITDLIVNLTSEREKLQVQVSALAKKRKLPGEKSKRKGNSHMPSSGKEPYMLTHIDFLKSYEEASDQSTMDVQVDKSASAVVANEMEAEAIVSTKGCTVEDSNVETVRTIDAAQIDWTYLLMIFLVLLVSVLTFYMYRVESSQA